MGLHICNFENFFQRNEGKEFVKRVEGRRERRESERERERQRYNERKNTTQTILKARTELYIKPGAGWQ